MSQAALLQSCSYHGVLSETRRKQGKQDCFSHSGEVLVWNHASCLLTSITLSQDLICITAWRHTALRKPKKPRWWYFGNVMDVSDGVSECLRVSEKLFKLPTQPALDSCKTMLPDNLPLMLELSAATSLCWSSPPSSLRALPALSSTSAVFSPRWPWRQGKTDLRGASRKLSRGQQDVHWLRHRGSKNSRKLLYFVEWAQECKMSASFFSIFFWVWVVSHVEGDGLWR